jgi:hypothetical protein
MKKATVYFMNGIFILCTSHAGAQIVDKEIAAPISVITREQIERTGQTNIQAVLAAIPFGDGAQTFGFGAGIGIQRNFNRSLMIVNEMPVNRNNTESDQFIITREEVEKYGSIGNALNGIDRIEIIKGGFEAEFGATHLFGKSEKIGNVTYDYDGLTILHGFVGYRRMPCDQGDLEIEAGPVLGIFQNGSEFGFGASINGFYNFTPPARRVYNIITTGKKKAEWSIGAGIDYYKLHEVESIFVPGLRLRANF